MHRPKHSIITTWHCWKQLFADQ